MEKIDFSKFKLNGKKCIIEVPTETQKGLLIMLNDKEQLKSGWFKLLKRGDQVTDWEEEQEVFIYLNHPPIFLNELIFQDKETQEKVLEDLEEKTNSVIEVVQSDFVKEEKVFKREFAVIQEYDILFAR